MMERDRDKEHGTISEESVPRDGRRAIDMEGPSLVEEAAELEARADSE
jgi:hypothetical protein